MKLNLGCGRDYRPGWTNVDSDPSVEPDLVFDLNNAAWPFPEASADYILLKFVLEHLGQSTAAFGAIMRELYRIAKPDAVVEIQSRHPLHRDFVDDPSCARRITPDMWLFYDLSVGEVWRAAQQPQRSLAPPLGVDFETVEVLYFPDPHLAERRLNGDTPIGELARTNNNIIQSTITKLRARKPFTPGRSLQRYGAICLERHSGMGDVVMALAAAKALKEVTGKPVYLLTSEPLRSLALICPVLDGVLTDAGAMKILEERYRDKGGVLHADLNAAKFGVSRLHQVDAYLEHVGLTAPASAKEIVLRDPATETHGRFASSLPPPANGRKRVLVHPAMGDPNRTWPAGKWRELCERLCRDGHQVVLIGMSTLLERRGVHAIDTPGVVNAMDRIGLLETLALMRVSEVLVSTDSGPIQLAGATSIHIVGLYSVVAGRQRLPFRQGMLGWRATALVSACSFSPCYQWVHDMDVVTREAPQNLQRLYSDWCPSPSKYKCMIDGIAVEDVYEAIGGAIGQPPIRQPEPRQARNNGSGLEIGAP